MYKAYKYRIYPTKKQELLLVKSFGCARWFWNYALNLCQETYKNTGKSLSRGYIQGLLPQLKKEYEWLKQPYAQCLQSVALNLSAAYKNFFDKRAMLPKFKSKHGRQSISYPQHVKFDGDKINRWFPSSKTCHVCLNRVDTLTLDVRAWTCKHCGTHHDRDVNAAINIKNEALRILALGTSASACGGDVSRSGKTSVLLDAIPVESGSRYYTI